MNILNKMCVLELNAQWFPVTVKPPRNVLENMFKETVFGLDMAYSDEDIQNEEYGNPEIYGPRKWVEWQDLPVRDYDLFVTTSTRKIRVPSIVICANYDKLNYGEPTLSKKNILRRDGYICQYTGQKLPERDLNVDHVIPKALCKKRGINPNTWENLVTCERTLNTRKGDLSVAEAGLKLLKQPRKPTKTQLYFADKFRDPKWQMFLNHLDN